ncbi:unnamed protein product [Pylaiella littoralis]
MTPKTRREGPVRARALARQKAAEGPRSATAWLKGSHEAIVLHPEWQQARSLQAHLQELATVAVRAHLDEACPQAHPHTIEAARQISGDIFEKDKATETFPGKAQPHLLHEPYMSEEGAAGMLGQTLADVAAKVDQEAEARGTLESTEFGAFRALVSSVYVGSLQRRAEYVENREMLLLQQQGQKEKGKGKLAVVHDNDDIQKAYGRIGNKGTGNGNGTGDGGGGGIGGDNDENVDDDTTKPGVARPVHQACSGDIAQALVAIAMGEGFEGFSSSSVSGGDSSAQAQGGGNDGKDSTEGHSLTLTKGHGGGYGRGANDVVGGSGAKGFKSGGGGSSNGRGGSDSFDNAQQQHRVRLQRESDNLRQAAAGLQYLSEDAATPLGGGRQPEKNGGDGHGIRSEAEGQFPGLEWLAPHIIGRSIPMELRRELWQRTLLRGHGGGPSPAEVERLIIRYAGEKGIVDPTNTPIAGMVATGVHHRAADAFPWLSRGGKADLDLRQRACRKAAQLLNQYFVFVGKHESRHVASSLLLTYVFSLESTAMTSGGRGGGPTGAATLVAMFHSLLTRFAPVAEDLRGGFRTRAYEEIRRRDIPLYEHLTTLFPAFKYAGGVGDEEGTGSGRDAAPAPTTTVLGDESKHPRGLVETWLEDAFVGYLREDAVLFVWDHLFLLGWGEQLPLFVADIALHLRASLLRATNPLTLLSLAREECRKICTRDVRDAFRRRRKMKKS